MDEIRFHNLRHTFATISLQSGVNVKALSHNLGHYSAGFTLDTYTHVTTQMQADAAEKIGGFMSQASGGRQADFQERARQNPSRVNIKALSHNLGHYSAGFTLDTYTHVTTQMQADAAEKIGGFMAKI